MKFYHPYLDTVMNRLMNWLIQIP